MQTEIAFDLDPTPQEGSCSDEETEKAWNFWDRRDVEKFCGQYWDKIHRFTCRVWGKSPEDAADLTQAFFLWILDKGCLRRYSSRRGRLWSFVKSLLRHFSADRHDALRSLKRCGGVRTLSLDRLPAGEATAAGEGRRNGREESSDRAWERGLIHGAIERSRQWYRASGRDFQFRVFEEHDMGVDGSEVTYADLAERFGIRESQVRNYLFQVRQRIRGEARAEIRRRGEYSRLPLGREGIPLSRAGG